MASVAEKRKKIETLVYQFMKAIDPSGNNYETYKELFSKMSSDPIRKSTSIWRWLSM